MLFRVQLIEGKTTSYVGTYQEMEPATDIAMGYFLKEGSTIRVWEFDGTAPGVCILDRGAQTPFPATPPARSLL